MAAAEQVRVLVTLALAMSLGLAMTQVRAHHGDTLLPYVVESGHFVAGLGIVGVGALDDGEPVPPTGMGAVNLASFVFSGHPCHPDLRIALGSAPENTTVGADRAALIMPHRFQIQLVDVGTDERLPNATFDFEGSGVARYTLPPEHARGTTIRADLYMIVGADVEWTLAIRGWLQHEGCVVVSEVEANPEGADPGNEWVELANLGFAPVDVSGWTIRALHGAPGALALPLNTSIPGGAHVVVAFPKQFLDNVEEVVTLEAADGVEYARTPALSDDANDARTNQLVPATGADWLFLTGTPGAPG